MVKGAGVKQSFPVSSPHPQTPPWMSAHPLTSLYSYYVDYRHYGCSGCVLWAWARVFQFEIKISKLQKMELKLARTNSFEDDITFYDGPGDKSPKIKGVQIHDYSALFDDFVLVTSSYHCVIDYIARHTSKAEIHFRSVAIQVKTEYPVDKEQPKSYSNDMCEKENSVCLLKFYTSQDQFVNVTINTLFYHGEEHIFCHYAGFAVFSLLENGSNVQTSIVCHHDRSGFFRYRPVYSQWTSIFLVLFSFKEYARLEVTFTLTSSLCQPVTVAMCNYKQILNLFLDGKLSITRETSQLNITLHLNEGDCLNLQLAYQMPTNPKHSYDDAGCEVRSLLALVPQPGKLVDYHVHGFLNGRYKIHLF